MARDCALPVLRDIFMRHSAVLSLTAVLLRKVPIVRGAANTAQQFGEAGPPRPLRDFVMSRSCRRKDRVRECVKE